MIKLNRVRPFYSLLVLVLLMAGCGLPGTIPTGGHLEQGNPTPTPASLPPIQFPQDEAPHHNLTEWWYYTGHFQGLDAEGKIHYYGFELTFFQTLRGALSPYYAAHFAISDISAGSFHFDQRFGFEPASVIPPPGSRSGFNLSLGGWSMRGLNGTDHLAAQMGDYAISFQLTATKPVVLEGPHGLITYGPAGFSYYYSRTRMQLSGELTDHGHEVQVAGLAWMDHQWGNFISLFNSGWDWFSIQLDNNTEYMLYILRDSQKKAIAATATGVARNGTFGEVGAADIAVHALSTWTSPHTGAVYPSGWTVQVASQHVSLRLMPELLDQELVVTASTGDSYWEGAVRISGLLGSQDITGVGYVELTGYAPVSSSA